MCTSSGSGFADYGFPAYFCHSLKEKSGAEMAPGWSRFQVFFYAKHISSDKNKLENNSLENQK